MSTRRAWCLVVSLLTAPLLAAPIDAGRSTATLDATTLPADGTSEAAIDVTLRDAQGLPVVGVPADNFIVESLPVGGLTAQFQPTNASGQARVRLRAVTPGRRTINLRVVDPETNQLVTLATGLSLRVVSAHTLRLEPGLNLVSVPLQLLDDRPNVVWSALQPRQIARWLPDQQVFQVLDVVAPQAGFEAQPGRAFWVQARDSRDILLAGDRLDIPQTSVSLTGSEWTLAGLPTTGAVEWDTDVLQVTVNDVPIGSLEQSMDFVAPYAWIWNAAQQVYTLVVDRSLGVERAASRIPAGHGFWLRRGDNPTIDGDIAVVVDLTRLSRAAQEPAADGWSFELVASGAGGSAGVTLGASSRLRADLAIAPPPSARPSALSLSVVHPVDRRALAGRLTPLGGSATWRLRLDSAPGDEVVLSWPQAGRALPAGSRAVLLDPATGRRLSLRSHGSLALPGGARELVVTVEPAPADRLAAFLSAQPTRARGLTATLTLTRAATVQVRVLGLGGGLVREWREDGVAGANALVWDGRDDAGRRVAAGTYRLEAQARDDRDDLVSVSALVAVR